MQIIRSCCFDDLHLDARSQWVAKVQNQRWILSATKQAISIKLVITVQYCLRDRDFKNVYMVDHLVLPFNVKTSNWGLILHWEHAWTAPLENFATGDAAKELHLQANLNWMKTEKMHSLCSVPKRHESRSSRTFFFPAWNHSLQPSYSKCEVWEVYNEITKANVPVPCQSWTETSFSFCVRLWKFYRRRPRVHVCVRACVRALCACVRVCVRIYACVRMCMRAYMCACGRVFVSLASDSSETIEVIIVKLGTVITSDMRMQRVWIIIMYLDFRASSHRS